MPFHGLVGHLCIFEEIPEFCVHVFSGLCFCFLISGVLYVFRILMPCRDVICRYLLPFHGFSSVDAVL